MRDWDTKESGSFRSYSCSVRSSRLGRFGPNFRVSRFGPIGVGSFRPISKVGRFGPILGVSRFGLIKFCVFGAWGKGWVAEGGLVGVGAG